MIIKAIETKHSGYHFRSRVEARYAVLFESLGIEYWYEYEGYDLGDKLYYLPDFILPKYQIFIEIKGMFPLDIEIRKAKLLAIGTKIPVAIAYGNIPMSLAELKTVNVNAKGMITQSNAFRDMLSKYSVAKLTKAFTAARSARF